MDGGAPEGGYGACPVMWPCRYMDYRWVSPTFWAWRYSKFLFAVPQVAGDLLLRQTAIMLPLRCRTNDASSAQSDGGFQTATSGGENM